MKNGQPYILYLGGIFSEETMLAYSAVSPAANRWQAGLLSALEQNGRRIYITGHLPEPLWPKGPPFLSDKKVLSPRFSGSSVGYLNLPFLRTKSLQREYLKSFKVVCREYGHPDAILSYNIYPHSAQVGLYAQQNMFVPWVPIIADVPETREERVIHDHISRQAAGRVFLSWKAFEDCRWSPRIHLDGGVNQFRPERPIKPDAVREKVVFFSGSMNRWGGVDLLVQAFSSIKDPSIKLWLCGKGISKSVSKLAANDARVTFFGCVSEEKLEELTRRADVLINPRPSILTGNQMNFPSKILEYLSYGKPVISTLTKGMSPEYENVLVFVREETPANLAAAINSVLGWDEDKVSKFKERAKKFIFEKKLWSIQGERLSRFIDEELLGKGCHD